MSETPGVLEWRVVAITPSGEVPMIPPILSRSEAVGTLRFYCKKQEPDRAYRLQKRTVTKWENASP